MSTSTEKRSPAICPLCGASYDEPPALSRDGKTLICPDCGIREALTTIGKTPEEQEKILAMIHDLEKERQQNDERGTVAPLTEKEEIMKQKFYFPLTVNVYERTEYGIDWDASTEFDGRIANTYRDYIEDAFDEYNADDIDMAKYFYGSETAKAKIQSCEWRFESIDRCLYGRVDFILSEPFTAEEIESVKNWITGQNSDGLGEGFEQRDIRTDDDVIQVSFWNFSDDYYVETEEEFKPRRAER